MINETITLDNLSGLDQIKDLSLQYSVLIYNENQQRWESDKRLTSLGFDHGILTIDRFTVSSVALEQHFFSWNQHSEHGFIAGELQYKDNFTTLCGRVYIGQSAENAESWYIFATAVPLGIHNVSNQQAITIGIETNQQRSPSLQVHIKDWDVTAFSHFNYDFVTESIRLMVDVLEDDSSLKQDFYLVTQFDKNKTNQLCVNSATDNPVLSSPPPMSNDLEAINLSSIEIPAKSKTHTDKPVTKSTMSLYDLISHLPDENKVADRTFNFIMDNMKWSMGQDTKGNDVTSRKKWLTNYFGQKPPTIDNQQRIKALEPDQNWYCSTMATALVGNSIANTELPRNIVPYPISENRKTKLSTYISYALDKENEYQKQQQAMFKFAYLNESSGIKSYIKADKEITRRNMQTGSHELTWAEKVFNYYTQAEHMDEVLNHMMTTTGNDEDDRLEEEIADLKEDIVTYDKNIDQLKAELDRLPADSAGRAAKAEKIAAQQLKRNKKSDRLKRKLSIQQKHNMLVSGRVKRITTLLYMLDPSGEKAQEYYKVVNNFMIIHLANQADLDEMPGLNKELSDYIFRLLQDIAKNRNNSIVKTIPLETINEIQTWMKQENANQVQKLMRRMSTVLTAAKGKTFLQKANNAQRSFDTKFPISAGIMRFLMVAMYVYTMYRVIDRMTDLGAVEDKLEKRFFYASVSSLLLGTFMSLLPNIRQTGSAIGEWYRGRVPGEPGVLSKIGRKIGEGFSWVAKKIASFGKWIGTGLAKVASALNHGFVKSITTFIGKMCNAVASAGRYVAGKFSEVYTRFVNSRFWRGVTRIVGKVLPYITKTALVLLTIGFTVKDFFDLKKLYDSDASVSEKALRTSATVAMAISSVAIILEITTASIVWAGAAGVVFALLGLGISILADILYKPKSNLQKLIDDVINPFVDGHVSNKLYELRETIKLQKEEKQLLEHKNFQLSYIAYE